MVTKIVFSDVEELKSLLGEGFHTAFRKVADSREGDVIYNALNVMPSADWDRVLDFVVSGLPVEDDM